MNPGKLKNRVKKILNLITGKKIFSRNPPLFSSVNKILIISLYFRGDFLFHTAFIEGLKKLFPDAEIDLWLKSRSKDIVSNDPGINEVLIFDDVKTASYRESVKINIKGKINFLKKIRAKHYDIVIDLTGKYSTAIFTIFSNANYTAGINYNYFGFCYDKFVYLNTYSQKGHLIEKYLSLLPEFFNLNRQETEQLFNEILLRPYIYIEQSVTDFINELIGKIIVNKDKPLIVIHATSGWKAKELDSEIFAHLLRYLIINNYNYVFIGDDKDFLKLNEIKSYLDANFVIGETNFQKLSFIQSAELIRRANLLIGSDSAPLHTAGAVGTPSIGIFGPTNPEFSKPDGDIHKIIYHRLYCSASDDKQYCTRNAGFTCPTIDCMKMVSVNEIIKNIEEILGK